MLGIGILIIIMSDQNTGERNKSKYLSPKEFADILVKKFGLKSIDLIHSVSNDVKDSEGAFLKVEKTKSLRDAILNWKLHGVPEGVSPVYDKGMGLLFWVAPNHHSYLLNALYKIHNGLGPDAQSDTSSFGNRWVRENYGWYVTSADKGAVITSDNYKWLKTFNEVVEPYKPTKDELEAFRIIRDY